MNPRSRTLEAISQIRRSAQQIQRHTDNAHRLNRERISDEAATVLAALRMIDPTEQGEMVDWCETHASVWDEIGRACQAAQFSAPYGARCRKVAAHVEIAV